MRMADPGFAAMALAAIFLPTVAEPQRSTRPQPAAVSQQSATWRQPVSPSVVATIIQQNGEPFVILL